MRLNDNIYRYVYNRLNSARNMQAVKKVVSEVIDPSDIRFALRDSRTINAVRKSNKPNVAADIIAGISQKVKNLVANYPKGTFKRTNTVYLEPITNKKHVIAYEGVKVDFDVTTEGYCLPKIRNYYQK